LRVSHGTDVVIQAQSKAYEFTVKIIWVSSRGSSSRRAAALPEKCKANDSSKFALSLDLVTKFHNIVWFSVLPISFWHNVS